VNRLEEALGLKPHQQQTDWVRKRGIELACDHPYRQARDLLAQEIGEVLSHRTLHRWVQEKGRELGREEEAQRRYKVLWAGGNGQLDWLAMPKKSLNNRYLNDDRQETITEAVEGPLLTVDNTATGSGVTGLRGNGEDIGVFGYSNSGPGVYGYSYYGAGLRADVHTGPNLIEAWDRYAPVNLQFRVERETGNVYADGSYLSPASDLAEMMATSEGVTYEPGDLLVIGPDGKPLPSSVPNATNLLVVYSNDPGFVGGVGDAGDIMGKIPVAITGTVPVKASTENGAILPGDLLTSSSIRGHAMKARPVTINGVTFYLPGTILGKALEPLEEGRGAILALVALQ